MTQSTQIAQSVVEPLREVALMVLETQADLKSVCIVFNWGDDLNAVLPFALALGPKGELSTPSEVFGALTQVSKLTKFLAKMGEKSIDDALAIVEAINRELRTARDKIGAAAPPGAG